MARQKYAAVPLKYKEVEGISAKTFAEHFKLYEGYVNKTNEIYEKIAGNFADPSKSAGTYSEYGEAKRQLSFTLGGMWNHKLYFGDFEDGRDTKPSDGLQKAMSEDFGSFDKWKEDFVATGMAARGWAMLCYGLDDGHLHNVVLDAQNAGFPATVVPVILMDVYEHAYFIDYGTARKPYVEAFFKNINWNRISKRFEKCVRMHKVWSE
ncbi:MAG: superoxide dismutase [Candidatus Thermoplasmatota archaeon]|nr:superoxide dismutase [Candidatus Thermoplasmatota archaeon]